jgi:hypothetical protein
MGETLYDCNCDVVVAMEEMNVGVEEILQYARVVLGRDEIRSLIYGLEKMVPQPSPVEA